MPNSEIPYRRERMILSRLMTDIFRIYYEGLARNGAPAEAMAIAGEVYAASFEGRGITLAKVAAASNTPRSTAERRLKRLMEAGFVEQRGGKYWVTQDKLQNPPTNIEASIRLVMRAYNELQKVKKI